MELFQTKSEAECQRGACPEANILWNLEPRLLRRASIHFSGGRTVPPEKGGLVAISGVLSALRAARSRAILVQARARDPEAVGARILPICC